MYRRHAKKYKSRDKTKITDLDFLEPVDKKNSPHQRPFYIYVEISAASCYQRKVVRTCSKRHRMTSQTNLNIALFILIIGMSNCNLRYMKKRFF